LSEALRISFIVLKVIMIVLVVLFLASGFKTVDTNEQALVLRFGAVRGVGEKRLLGPGLHWVFPYPIDEIIRIPVETTVHLSINSFWYPERPEDMLSGQERPVPPGTPLDPLKDGYCITRDEKQDEATVDAEGSDYNLVHAKWQLTYQINDPERFFRNVYVRTVGTGDVYFDVITSSIEPLLKDLFEGAVVTTMVNYTIDEAISSQQRIPDEVENLMQEKLDRIQSGINVVSVQLTRSTPPRQVKPAFEASTLASQKRDMAITQARTYAETTLNEAAGPVAEELFAALHDKTSDEQTRELLWEQLAGKAQEKLGDAEIYATKVVENARANADYLESLLPEYKERPKLVLQRIYLDAMENILNNAEEKFIIQPTEGTEGTEIRVLLNRDPSLKRQRSGSEETTQENQ
jgi:regulator of protease activity HflC (stomatin/prohibitin superfamily)